MGIIERLVVWNPWWKGSIPKEVVGKRRLKTEHILKWVDEREIKVLVGPRRAGKSTILYQVIDEITREKVDPENVLLLNFQDPLINERPLKEIYLEYIKELNPKGKIYVFLDEAQEKQDWVKWVKSMYDSNRKVCFFVTGSNAKLLRDDYSYYLSGRTVKFEIYPLNFREFLYFKGVKSKHVSEEDEARIGHYYKEYVKYGGFPEVFFKPESIKLELLQNYLDDFIIRDVVERYNVDKDKVQNVLRWILTNAGKPFSYARLERVLRISGETIERYVRFLKEAYLIFEVKYFSPSLSRQAMMPRKFYPIDMGLESVYSFSYREEGGKKLENAVAIELFTNNNELYYYRNDFEVDFIVRRGNELKAIHVSHRPEISREQRAVENARRKLRIKDNLFVSLKGEHAFWRFCLNTLPGPFGRI